MNVKYLLLLILGVFFAWVLSYPKKAILRKGFIIAFVVAMLIFTVRPEWSTAIAQYVGVGRGADFLFYMSHLVLFFIAFVYYLRFKSMEMRFTKLVRQLALDAALGGSGKALAFKP